MLESNFELVGRKYVRCFIAVYLFIVLCFQTPYNNCIKEAGIPQQLNTNYSGPFTKYQYKYRNRNNQQFLAEGWVIIVE